MSNDDSLFKEIEDPNAPKGETPQKRDYTPKWGPLKPNEGGSSNVTSNEQPKKRSPPNDNKSFRVNTPQQNAPPEKKQEKIYIREYPPPQQNNPPPQQLPPKNEKIPNIPKKKFYTPNFNKQTPPNEPKKVIPTEPPKKNLSVDTSSQQLLKKPQNDLKPTSPSYIKMQQNDPNSPLYSKHSSFTNLKLPKNIIKGLHSLGFSKPSKIQAMTIPLIMNAKWLNIIAQSQSGTGKTACFAIAILMMIDLKILDPQVVVVSPTMELADQNFNVIGAIGKYVDGVRIIKVTKGKRFNEKIQGHILCGTPGSLLYVLKRRKIDAKKIKLFVLDEADALLEAMTNSLRDQTYNIKRLLLDNRSESEKLRIMLFSATYQEVGGFESKEDEEKEKKLHVFAEEFVSKPLSKLLVPKEKLTLENMRQYWIPLVTFDEKVRMIGDLYSYLTIGQSIIFLNKKVDANNLKDALEKDKHTVSLLHASMSVEERQETLEKFKKNINKVLISTNVLSRGLDVPTVTIVINFDLPINYENKTEPDYSTYLHRIGRTARFGAKGTAINFVEKEVYPMVKKIEDYFKIKIIQKLPEDVEDIKLGK